MTMEAAQIGAAQTLASYNEQLKTWHVKAALLGLDILEMAALTPSEFTETGLHLTLNTSDPQKTLTSILERSLKHGMTENDALEVYCLAMNEAQPDWEYFTEAGKTSKRRAIVTRRRA